MSPVVIRYMRLEIRMEDSPGRVKTIECGLKDFEDMLHNTMGEGSPRVVVRWVTQHEWPLTPAPTGPEGDDLLEEWRPPDRCIQHPNVDFSIDKRE